MSSLLTRHWTRAPPYAQKSRIRVRDFGNEENLVRSNDLDVTCISTTQTNPPHRTYIICPCLPGYIPPLQPKIESDTFGMILFIAEFITLACLVSIASPLQTTAVHQLPFQNNIGKPPATFRSPSGPPGTNRATYGPVPKSQQLFEIEYLEFAPSPFLR